MNRFLIGLLIGALLLIATNPGVPCPDCDYIPSFDGSGVQLRTGIWFGWLNEREVRKAQQEALLQRIKGPGWKPVEVWF